MNQRIQLPQTGRVQHRRHALRSIAAEHVRRISADRARRTIRQIDHQQQRTVPSHKRPSGFMLFKLIDHGAWVTKAGIDRRAMRVILGNPLIAITMLRHDVTAGLFAPVELLLVDEGGGRSSLTYVKPSSLMVVEPNPE